MKLKLAIIGAGQRGNLAYSRLASSSEKFEITAVAEIDDKKREEFQKQYNLKDEYVFDDWQKILSQPKLADAVVIATNDDMHYEPTKLALQLGYHVLLEKPMSNKLEECVSISNLSEKYADQIVMVCHVLRYTSFFNKIKELLDNKEIGDIVTIAHNENIGYYHFAHSFVRGNWNNSDETSPLILSKSCHDMDILLFLTNSNCTRVSSFGNLMHFKRENAPKDSADNCIDCPSHVKNKCVYNAEDFYSNSLGKWPSTAIAHKQDKEAIKETLKTHRYGRCVYRHNNNVVDHMSSILEFENGITATFNLSAFSNEITRTIKIMGTKGEIRGHMEKNEIILHKFADNLLPKNEKQNFAVIKTNVSNDGHGGGDKNIIDSFYKAILNKGKGNTTSAQISLQSHLMAFALEYSRVNNVSLSLEEFRKNI